MTSRNPNKYCHNAKIVADFLGSEEWGLPNKYWWNYVTSLRGPDLEDSEFDPLPLKALLTCVLRGTLVNEDDEIPVAWDIFHTLDYNEFFYLLDRDKTVYLVKSLGNDKLDHYKHHTALGFDALSLYYGGLVDDGIGDDVIYNKCKNVLHNIYFDLHTDHLESVFVHVKEFLLLVSNEIPHSEITFGSG